MKEKIECPTCTGKNGGFGLGAIEDRDQWAAGGKPWHECWNCDGTGFVNGEEEIEPNELLKELV